jgi:hypothetical protein
MVESCILIRVYTKHFGKPYTIKEVSIDQRNMENGLCLYESLAMGHVLILKIRIISALRALFHISDQLLIYS